MADSLSPSLPKSWLLCIIVIATQTSLSFALVGPSNLIGSRWKVLLDVGFETGTWMQKNTPGWAESGGRLPVSVEVEFNGRRASESEELVGPKESTGVVKVYGPSKFISERGEQIVHWGPTADWCIQRTNEEMGPGAQSLLRFWIDCENGAKRRDVFIPEKERIFFSTGVWDDKGALQSLLEKRDNLEMKVETSVSSYGGDDNGGRGLSRLLAFPNEVRIVEERQKLRERLQKLNYVLPPRGAPEQEGVRIFPKGSMAVKRKKFPFGTEYHILGTFGVQSSADRKT